MDLFLVFALAFGNGMFAFLNYKTNKQLRAAFKREEQWQKLCAQLQEQLDVKSPLSMPRATWEETQKRLQAEQQEMP